MSRGKLMIGCHAAIAFAIVLVGLVLVAGETQAEDSLGFEAWSTFQKNVERTGTTFEPINQDNTTVWTYNAESIIATSPVVVDGVVYFATYQTATLYAVDYYNGEEIWTTQFPQLFLWQGFSVDTDHNQIYVANDFYYALDLETGQINWKFDSGSPWNIEINTPVYADDYVYFGSLGGHVYKVPAIDPNGDGLIDANEMVWEFVTGTYVGDNREEDSEGWVFGSPTVVGNRVYFATANEGGQEGSAYVSKMYSLDGATGDPVWVYDFGEFFLPYTGDHAGSGPSVDLAAGDNGLVFVGNSNTLYAFDVEGETNGDSPTDADNWEEGEVVWSYETDSGYIFSSAAYHNDRVFTTAGDGKLYALNEADGTLDWSFTTHTGWDIFSSAVVSEGTVIFGGLGGYIYAINETDGSLVWDYLTDWAIYASPAIYDERIYIPGLDGWLYTFSFVNNTPPINLAITSEDLQLSLNPRAGEPVTVFATVTNYGEKSAWNVNVSFYMDDGMGERFLGNTTLPRVRPFGGVSTAIYQWVPEAPGPTIIRVQIVNYTDETSFDDNEATAAFPITSGDARPIARILDISPYHVLRGSDQVIFTGEGSDDGTIAAFEWTSSLSEEVLSTAAEFNMTADQLAKGVHLVYLRVQDDSGQWSDYDTGLVVVEEDFDDDWLMAAKDLERTGVSASSLDLSQRPEPTWVFETKAWVLSSPVVVDGVVYVASFDANLYALDYITGKQLWNLTLGAVAYSTPAVDPAANRLYICADVVYAIDIRDGSVAWTFDTDSPYDWEINSPVYHDGKVFVGSLDGYMYAINAGDGSEAWSFATGTYVGNVREPDSEGWIYGSPTVVDSKVFFSTANEGGQEGAAYVSKMYALSEDTGEALWVYNFGEGFIPYTGDHSGSGPSVDLNAGPNGLVFVGNADAMYAFDVEGQSDGDSFLDSDFFEEGELVWEYDPDNGGGYIFSSGSHYSGKVFFTSSDWYVYALNAETGQPLWEFQTNYQIWGSVVIAEDQLYVGSLDFNLYCLDLDGNLQWFYRTGYPITSTPAIYNDGLILTSADYKVYAYTLYHNSSDLALDRNLINLDPSEFVTGDPVTITAGVRNLGYADSRATLSFYIDSVPVYQTTLMVYSQSMLGATFVWNTTGFNDSRLLQVEVEAWGEDANPDNDYLEVELASLIDQFPPPVVAITSISPNPARHDPLVQVTFGGRLVAGGNIDTYYWNSSLDGVLAQVGTAVVDVTLPGADLTIGYHTITLVALDSKGRWSNEAASNLLVYGDKPLAVLQAAPDNVSVGQAVNFDGSLSFTGQGTLTDYLFTYGDGQDSGWQPSATVTHSYSAPGTYLASLKVRDSTNTESDNLAQVTIIVTTTGSTNAKPEVIVILPEAGSSFKLSQGQISFWGSASDDNDVLLVEVSLDNGPWSPAEGTKAWKYTLDLATLSEGQHTLAIRAYDGTDYSEVAQVTFTLIDDLTPTSNGQSDDNGLLIAAVGGVAGLGLLGLVAFMVMTGRLFGGRWEAEEEPSADYPAVFDPTLAPTTAPALAPSPYPPGSCPTCWEPTLFLPQYERYYCAECQAFHD